MRAFFDSVDRRTGSFLHLPASGGSLDQPSKTMAVFEAIQVHFNDHIEAEMKRKTAGRGK